jgi:hypothetical protein
MTEIEKAKAKLVSLVANAILAGFQQEEQILALQEILSSLEGRTSGVAGDSGKLDPPGNKTDPKGLKAEKCLNQLLPLSREKRSA